MINFDKPLVFDPKIDIVGKEVPLAAMEKVGATLQDRYDKSYENFSKFQELAKQTEQIADKYEREKVKNYLSSLEPQIKDIQSKGDFHNMRWQTMSLANNAANNLKIFGERAKTAEDIRNKLRLTKEIIDPRIRKMYEDEFNRQFAETTYNPENQTFNFAALQAPEVVTDVNAVDIVNKGLQGWAANKVGTSWNNIQIIKPGDIIPGSNQKATSTLVYDIKGKKLVSGITEAELKKGAEDLLNATPEVGAVINRNAKFLMTQNPELDINTALQIAKKELIDPAVNFGVNKFSYTEDVTDQDRGVNSTLTSMFQAATPTQQPFDLGWYGVPNNVATDKAVEPIMAQKNEITSEAFNKDGSFKGIPETFMKNLFTNTAAAASGGGNGHMVPLKSTAQNSLNTLVPDWQQAIIRNRNPKATDKEVYEAFMDEKINAQKQVYSTYTLIDPNVRSAVNDNMKAVMMNLPLYKKDGTEVTDVDERTKAFKNGIGFIPGTGQITLGNDYVSPMGVINPNADMSTLAPTQKAMGMVSYILKGLYDPSISNGTTAGKFDIKIGNGTPVVARFLKTRVGQNTINNQGQKTELPSVIELRDQNDVNRVIARFDASSPQGISDFTKFMLNETAGAFAMQ